LPYSDTGHFHISNFFSEHFIENCKNLVTYGVAVARRTDNRDVTGSTPGRFTAR